MHDMEYKNLSVAIQLPLCFICLVSNREIDEIYYLQNYKEGWTDGKWEEKMDERKCIEKTGFVQVDYLEILCIFNVFMS